jgi:hypothetical protein
MNPSISKASRGCSRSGAPLTPTHYIKYAHAHTGSKRRAKEHTKAKKTADQAIKSKERADKQEERRAKKAEKAEKKRKKSGLPQLPPRSTSWRSINGVVRTPSISTPQDTNYNQQKPATSNRKAQL